MIPMNCNSTRHDRYGNGHEWPWIKSIKVIVCYSADFWNLLGYFWVISGNFGNLLAVHFAAKLARSLLGRDQWPVASELVTHFHPRQRSNGCLMQVLLEVVIHNMCIYIIYIYNIIIEILWYYDIYIYHHVCTQRLQRLLAFFVWSRCLRVRFRTSGIFWVPPHLTTLETLPKLRRNSGGGHVLPASRLSRTRQLWPTTDSSRWRLPKGIRPKSGGSAEGLDASCSDAERKQQ
jgi:hypothetical protein